MFVVTMNQMESRPVFCTKWTCPSWPTLSVTACSKKPATSNGYWIVSYVPDTPRVKRILARYFTLSLSLSLSPSTGDWKYYIKYLDLSQGDSGGPLMFQREDGRWTLGGTVSHGIRCAYPNMPGVYMRMTYYRPWIERVTGIGGSQLGWIT